MNKFYFQDASFPRPCELDTRYAIVPDLNNCPIAMWMFNKSDLQHFLLDLLDKLKPYSKKYSTIREVRYNRKTKMLFVVSDVKLGHIFDNLQPLYSVIHEIIREVDFEIYEDLNVGSTLIPQIMFNCNKILQLDGGTDVITEFNKLTMRQLTLEEFEKFDYKNKRLNND